MQTRTELILNFMLALSQNSGVAGGFEMEQETAETVYNFAVALTDKYLKEIS